MRCKKILFITLLLPFCASGQWLHNPFLDDPETDKNHRRKIQAALSYKLGSTALTNRFFNDYLFTPYLEDEVKNTVLPKLKEYNYFGGYIERQLLYTWQPEGQPATRKSTRSYFAGLKSRVQYGSYFRPDLYKVLFYGNKSFAGRTASADSSAYRHAGYQTLYGGIILQRNIKENAGRAMLYGGGIGLVKGGRFLEIKADEASLYTSSTGDSIFLRAKTQAAFTEVDERGIEPSGVGLSAHVFLQYPINEKNRIGISLSDLGFISYFGNSSIRFSSDESFSYTGEDISGFSFNKGISGSSFILDSLVKRADSLKARGGFTRMLPGQLQIFYSIKPGEKFEAKAGLEYVVSAFGRPQVYGIASWYPGKQTGFSTGVQYGGYNGFGVIATADITIKKRIRLLIGTENLEAWIKADKTTAQSAFGRMEFLF